MHAAPSDVTHGDGAGSIHFKHTGCRFSLTTEEAVNDVSGMSYVAPLIRAESVNYMKV